MAEVVQSELSCPACGGQRHFDPAAGLLSCDSCGATEDLSSPWDGAAQKEHPVHGNTVPATERPAQSADTADVTHVQCQACGSQLTFVGLSLSERCGYCDGPVVRKDPDPTYAPMALIPFAIAQDAARLAQDQWVASRLFAPRDLPERVAEGTTRALYVPFWTIDAQEATTYWAKKTVRSGKNTRVENISGEQVFTFDDLLMPASPLVTPLIRDGILHEFEPARLRPYTAGYIAGFAAEQHAQTLADGLAANRKDRRLLIRNRIRKKYGWSGVHSITFNTDTSGVHYRRILLPVWITHYKDGRGVASKVVTCGIHGRTYGERPFSRRKVLAASMAVVMATVLFGLIWGAGAAL